MNDTLLADVQGEGLVEKDDDGVDCNSRIMMRMTGSFSILWRHEIMCTRTNVSALLSANELKDALLFSLKNTQQWGKQYGGSDKAVVTPTAHKFFTSL